MGGEAARPRMKDFEPERDPIWSSRPAKRDGESAPTSGCCVAPSPAILSIWQLIAQARYGDPEQTDRVARDLGYLVDMEDVNTGEPVTEILRFDYDGSEVREAIGLDQDMPLVHVRTEPSNRLASIFERLLGRESNE